MADLEISIGIRDDYSKGFDHLEERARKTTSVVETEAEKMGAALDRALGSRSDILTGSPPRAAGGPWRLAPEIDPMEPYCRRLRDLSAEHEDLIANHPLSERIQRRREINSEYWPLQETLGAALNRRRDMLSYSDDARRMLDSADRMKPFTPQSVLKLDKASDTASILPGRLPDVYDVYGREYAEYRSKAISEPVGDDFKEFKKQAEEMFDVVAKLGSKTLGPAFNQMWNDVFEFGENRAANFFEKLANSLGSVLSLGVAGGLLAGFVPGYGGGFWGGFRKILGLQRGGFVGGTGGPDSQLRLLSPREYVVNERAAGEHLPLLDAINSRGARGPDPRYLSPREHAVAGYAPLLGGINSARRAGPAPMSATTITINVTAIDVRDFQQKLSDHLPEVLSQLRRVRAV